MAFCLRCKHSDVDHERVIGGSYRKFPCNFCDCKHFKNYQLEGQKITKADIHRLLVICGTYILTIKGNENDGLEKYRKTCHKIMQNIEQLEKNNG